MSFASKYNKGGNVFNIDTEGWTEYRDLKSLLKENGPDKEYPVHGFYINRKSQYGDAPVIISDGFYVNAPRHMLDDVIKIMGDAEAIDAVNNGLVAFKVRTYEAKNYNNKKCYGVEFVDVE